MDIPGFQSEAIAFKKLKQNKDMTRYFQHVDGFDGITKTLAFFLNGDVWGYDADGELTFTDFAVGYNFAYAKKQVSLGIWKEVESQ